MGNGFMIQENKKITIPEYLLLFLGFLNFTGRGTYFLIVFAGIYIFSRKRLIHFNMKTGAKIYLLFFIAYLSAVLLFLEYRDIMAPVCGLLLFFVGQVVAMQTEDKNEIRRFIFVAIAGQTVHGILNFLFNVSKVEKLAYRQIEDIWLGLQQATGHMSVFVPLIAASFVILFLTKSHWINRIFSLACLMIGIIYTFMCATRFIFYFFLIVVATGIALYFIEVKARRYRRNMFRKIGSLILILTILFAFNLFGIRTALLTSNLTVRVEGFGVDSAFTSVDRSKQIREVLSNFEQYLLGGKPTGIPFIHNAWISALNLGGIFLFFAFIVLTCRMVYVLFCCKKRVELISFAYLFGYVICILMYCWIESILDSSRILFYSMSMTLGIMEGITARSPIKMLVESDDGKTDKKNS